MKQQLIVAAAVLISLMPAFGQAEEGQKPVHPAMSSARTSAEKPKDAAKPKEVPLSGKVMQTMNGGGYTYVLLKQADGKKVWLAIPQTEIELGAHLTFQPGMEMTNLSSKALNRTFDKIIFSQGLVAEGKGGKKGAKKSPGSKGAVAAAEGKIKVKKATGANAYTVADLYRLKDKLDKKNVVVRGKVVRVSANIMGKNWIHLQDGSGEQKKGTHNLVVTSKALPVIGEVVTAKGVLYKNKDFGGGYRYDVIMEKAELEIQ
ncbi:DNA-binding protein [Geotalea sp. SG265]|uniref:DNA-binding protein n=1 Tax=Geotalea sp. SG265 TaxID=2922867 RepID=UPI001FAE9365|nr:DNA-binding protein [Geotalea sp. SG265]